MIDLSTRFELDTRHTDLVREDAPGRKELVTLEIRTGSGAVSPHFGSTQKQQNCHCRHHKESKLGVTCATSCSAAVGGNGQSKQTRQRTY